MTQAPFHTRIAAAPVLHDRERAERVLGRDRAPLRRAGGSRCPRAPHHRAVRAGPADGHVRRLALSRRASIERHPASLLATLTASPEQRFAELRRTLDAAMASADSITDAMRALRLFKTDVALLTALCDLAGVWPVMTVTRRLSEAADAAVVDGRAASSSARPPSQGEWLGDRARRLHRARHGQARRLRAQLLLRHRPHRLLRSRARAPARRPRRCSPSSCALTRDLVRLLHERTGDGYVFRTDLRLRPDPGSTPLAHLHRRRPQLLRERRPELGARRPHQGARPSPAISPPGRPCSQSLAPYIWRKYLDFAAIADIHAMKRQIHAFRGFGRSRVAGHNIKVGRGGIREIEFFVQTQQLIAGGRQPRAARVGDAGRAGASRGARAGSPPAVARRARRGLPLPAHGRASPADGRRRADPDAARGSRQARRASPASAALPIPPRSPPRLTAELERVQAHYVRLFEHSPELTRGGANMVFAGEADDPGTRRGAHRHGLHARRRDHRRRARLASRPLPRRAHARAPASC